jgi:hypothetical protein
MTERERNGVSLGRPVRDLDGKSLGKVVRLFDWGFQSRRLLGISHVFRYDEVRAVRDGALVVARSSQDLFELAAGEVPRSWRIPTPPAFPDAATPLEALYLMQDVAAARVRGVTEGQEPERPAPPAPASPSDAELRTYVDTRGESLTPQPSQSDHR